MMCGHDIDEPEEVTFGCVNGKVLLIRSDDIEPVDLLAERSWEEICPLRFGNL